METISTGRGDLPRRFRFRVSGQRELLAYRAQGAWLGLFGTSLESAFGIDAATLLVATACTH